MQVEVVPTWELDSHDVLVLVMAAGVNYNGVWAALGTPISVFDVHKIPYHIAGSDASGIVYAVGFQGHALGRSATKSSSIAIRTTMTTRSATAAIRCCRPRSASGATRRLTGRSPSSPACSRSSSCRARSTSPGKRAPCYTLTLATAYRMLFGHRPHTLEPGQNVLVWGASGGLGSFAVQLCATAGAHAIGVISDESKRDYVMSLGAKGVINRKDFNCWGQLPKVNSAEFNDFMKEARKFGKAIWDITGKGHRPGHRFRASGRSDFPRFLHGGQARRHGRLLRRHLGLQHHLRRAFRLDASEAHSGLAFRASEAGLGREPARHRAPYRSGPVGSLLMGRHSEGAI